MPIITHVQAREVLDSRGNPTVEVEVLTEAVLLDALSFHQVHQRVNMKLLNLRDGEQIVTLVKVF